MIADWDPGFPRGGCDWYSFCKDYCPPDDICRHCGMDIAIPFGTEIRVAQAGRATISAFPDRWGTYRIWVTTDVGAEVHVYQHLSSFNGERHYDAGDVLGRSGCAESNHLHFERRVPDNACVAGYKQFDPTSLLEHAPIGMTDVADWIEGMDRSLAQRWYGRRTTPDGLRRFEPTAAECVLWKKLGRFPRLLKVDRFDTREYLIFSDGTIIWRPNENNPYRVMAASGPAGSFPAGMDAALARRWFGRVTVGERTYHFSPGGAVSLVWLKGGQFAKLVAVEDSGTARYYVFANGTVIWRPNPETAPALLERAAAGTMPAGLTDDRATRWFGSIDGVTYDTDDGVRRLWLSLGRFPLLKTVERYGTRTYLRFADGSVIWRSSEASAFRLLK
jgi:hypothetical protein